MSKKYYIAAGILVICAGGVFALSIYKGGGQAARSENISQPVSASTSAPVGAEESLGKGLAEYSSQPYHFSIRYPDTLNAQEHREKVGGPLAVLIATKDGSQFIRIFAVPYNERTVSKERFLADIPSGVKNKEVGVTVDGASGTMFESRDAQIGETVEIWFIRGGILYEVDAPLSEKTFLQQVMGTWKFI